MNPQQQEPQPQQPPQPQYSAPPILPPAQPYTSDGQPVKPQPRARHHFKLVAVFAVIVIMLIAAGAVLLLTQRHKDSTSVQNPNSGLTTPQPPR